MLWPDDVVEAVRDIVPDRPDPPIHQGDRGVVAAVSMSGAFVRLHGFSTFIHVDGFKKIGHMVETGGCAPPAEQGS